MLRVQALKLRDRTFGNWHAEIVDSWNYQDFVSDQERREDWISFDCLCYVPEVNTVFAGVTSFATDILWGYDRGESRWVDGGFRLLADPYDAKLHRSLVRHRDKLYGAVALLHDVDRYWDAPGGAIVEFDYQSSRLRKIGIPIPHTYIQAIALDAQRSVLYGQTFTPERLFSFDLLTGSTRDLGLIGSGMMMAQAQNIVLDDKGAVWGSWGVTRAWQDWCGKDAVRLFRFDPGCERIDYLPTGLPDPDNPRATVQVDALFNFHTGCLYASGGNGSLYRIDVQSGKAEHLFRPLEGRPARLSAIAVAPDGMAYGVVGKQGDCHLMRFDYRSESHSLLGRVEDASGVRCWQVHDIVSTHDGVLFAGENDVPDRSGYLWEISVP